MLFSSRRLKAGVMVAPAAVLLVAFTGVPLIQVVAYSLTDADFLSANWVGLENYLRYLRDPVFWRTLAQTLLYVALVATPVVLGPLAIATSIYDLPSRLKRFAVIALCAPIYTAGMVIVPLIRWAFHPTPAGLMNQVMVALGGKPVLWFSDGISSIFIISMFCVWCGYGLNIVYYLANIQAIPQAIFDAACADGATQGQVRRRIVVPMLSGPTAVLSLVSMIGAFFVVEFIFLLTQGGPNGGSANLMYLIFTTTVDSGRYGRACALNVLMIALVLFLSVVKDRISVR